MFAISSEFRRFVRYLLTLNFVNTSNMYGPHITPIISLVKVQLHLRVDRFTGPNLMKAGVNWKVLNENEIQREKLLDRIFFLVK